MSRTSTTFIDFDSLALKGEEGVLIVKLMMAFNDLAITNESLSIFKERYQSSNDNKDWGASMYFVRLQFGHLFEAMTIIEQITKNDAMVNLVERCSENAKNAFTSLRNCLKGGSAKDKFEQYIGRMRSNITFHYDESGKLISRAIERRSKTKGGNVTSLTRGSHGYLWRFKVADDVIDTIVCREIWKIDDADELKQAADQVVDYGYRLFEQFTEFVSEYVFKFIKNGT